MGFASRGVLPPLGVEVSYFSTNLWFKGCPRRYQFPDILKLAHPYGQSIPQVPTEKIHLSVQGSGGEPRAKEKV